MNMGRCGNYKYGHMDTRTRDKFCVVGTPDPHHRTEAEETVWLLMFSMLGFTDTWRVIDKTP